MKKGFNKSLDYKGREIELMALLRGGDKSAFQEIFNIYWKEIYQHAYSKLKSKEEAEEIVQDIFTTLWVRREELLITNLSYYLHASVKNKVLNHLRSQMVHQKYWDFYRKFIPAGSCVTEEVIDYGDLKVSIEKATSFLSKKTKVVFQLSRIEGYSTTEIAKKLNISEKAVEYHITQLIKELKVHLKDYLTSWSVLIYFTIFS